MLRDGIIATAQAIGADPLDLATVISYETAGTFDPTKAGPTTQWGQHRGLIQFGEPQAQQYGVDWNDPIGSQLGPNGAVARYLIGSGYKPGMGLLDLYSIINAGAPGRYTASDANNGGAPGTVADKVFTQMGGHREKARALLGGAGADILTGNAGDDTLGGDMTPSQASPLAGLLSRLTNREPAAPLSPMAPKERGSLWDRIKSPDTLANLAIGLQGMTIDPNEGFIDAMQSGIERRSDNDRQQRTVEWLAQQPGGADYAAAISAGMSPQEAIGGFMEARQGPSEIEALQMAAAAQGLQRGELEIDALRNPQPETTASITEYERAKAEGYEGTFADWKKSGGAGADGLSLNPIYGVGPNGETVILQTSRTGEVVRATMPDGVTISQKPIEVDTGTEVIFLDPLTRQPVARVSKENREAAAETAAGSAAGKAEVEKEQAAPQVIERADEGLRIIDSILKDPALPQVVGKIQGRMDPEGMSGVLMSQEGVNLVTRMGQLEGQAFTNAFESLRGGGQITEREGQAATRAIANLSRLQDEKAYAASLGYLRTLLENAKRRAKGEAVDEFLPGDGSDRKRLRYNPETGEFE